MDTLEKFQRDIIDKLCLGFFSPQPKLDDVKTNIANAYQMIITHEMFVKHSLELIEMAPSKVKNGVVRYLSSIDVIKRFFCREVADLMEVDVPDDDISRLSSSWEIDPTKWDGKHVELIDDFILYQLRSVKMTIGNISMITFIACDEIVDVGTYNRLMMVMPLVKSWFDVLEKELEWLILVKN